MSVLSRITNDETSGEGDLKMTFLAWTFLKSGFGHPDWPAFDCLVSSCGSPPNVRCSLHGFSIPKASRKAEGDGLPPHVLRTR